MSSAASAARIRSGFLYLHDRLKDLIAWTRDRVAHFKCPAGVSFAASLARTASGKLQKQAIRASLRSPAVP